MSDFIDFALTIGVLAFFTAPIWWPIAAVSRIERDLKECRRHAEDAE